MHDSGKREQFDTGAVRDTADSKSRPDLSSPFAAERLGNWLRDGARKYAAWNWAKGMPISRCIASLERHLMQYRQGDASEDHMAAIMCNAMFVLHYEEMIKRSWLPKELADMPDWKQFGQKELPVDEDRADGPECSCTATCERKRNAGV